LGGPRIPRDGASAGLCWLGTYRVWKCAPVDSAMSCNRRKTRLVCRFLLAPFHHPSTTPVLSPWHVKWKLWPWRTRRVRARSSKATASAHPMSRPWECQSPMRVHARQCSPTTMPRPTPELASEKALWSWRMIGPGIGCTKEGRRRRENHHSRSAWVPLGGVQGWNGEL
jgi:hypothetical protein